MTESQQYYVNLKIKNLSGQTDFFATNFFKKYQLKVKAVNVAAKNLTCYKSLQIYSLQY
jgi:hypothetical protein